MYPKRRFPSPLSLQMPRRHLSLTHKCGPHTFASLLSIAVRTGAAATAVCVGSPAEDLPLLKLDAASGRTVLLTENVILGAIRFRVKRSGHFRCRLGDGGSARECFDSGAAIIDPGWGDTTFGTAQVCVCRECVCVCGRPLPATKDT